MALLITISNNFFAALRLRSLLGKDTSLISLIKVNLIGSFFSIFLPTNFGGDVFRARFIRPKLKNYSEASAIIFIDRFLGLSVLLVYGLLGMILIALLENVKFPNYIYLYLGFFICFTIGIWISVTTDKVLGIINKYKRVKKINEVHDYVANISKLAYFNSLLWALVLQINVILFNFFLAKSIGLDISLLYFLAIIPITNLFLIIPLSFNGLGIRDYLYVNLFEGATKSSNLYLLGPTNFFANAINGAIGGIVYLTTERDKLWTDKDSSIPQQLPSSSSH
ncbi:MAG: lysylphosphatidylglycerol synthase transmembrane domain-containing protein [Candidatus Dojkabacteria bacterium]|nr:lysylphosphatidylglycerol synthase transmembrane domain-containing protein [Candidatus Dojkabacteria bacterium]